MADIFTCNISENFDLQKFTEDLTQQYQGKGFNVRTTKTKNSVKIVFDKKCGGANMLFGLGQGVTATCTVQGKERDILSVNFSDGDWTGKFIGLGVGLFLCFIPFITALIGLFRQLSLPKNIGNDIQMLLSDME